MQHSERRQLWSLNPDIAYLNHGSFGATPNDIVAHQRSIQNELEYEPVQFMLRTMPERLWKAQEALGAFMGAVPEDIVLMDNATSAVNSIIAHFPLKPGDEVLFVDQVYGACRKTAEFYAKRAGAQCRSIPLPLGLSEPQEIVELVKAAWTPKCKLLLFDHICSPTGWVLPAAEIVQFYESKGTPVLVDGAHALGQIPLALDELGASYYVANAHKWLCTPKGSAMLHVRKDRQSTVHAPAVSQWSDWVNPTKEPTHPRYSRFQMSHAWTGTRDASAVMTIPYALKWMNKLHPDGWTGLQNENTRRAKVFRRKLSETFNEPVLCPDSMVGHMGSILLPESIRIPEGGDVPIGQGLSPLWDILYQRYGIEVVVFPFEERLVLRFSIQVYVTDVDLEHLRQSLIEMCH